MELGKEGVRVVAQEDVGAAFDGQVVIDLVVYVGTQIGVLVGG